MKSFSVLVLSLIIAASTFAQTTARPELPEQTPHLSILSARTDAGNIILHVEGRNFCTAPSVTFGGNPVAIAGGATATSLDVLLPAGVQPGTYLLEVSCGKGAIRNDDFVVNILPAVQ